MTSDTFAQSASPRPTSSRILSLDALRGLAVFLMIEQHVGIWLWKGPAPGKGVFDYPVLVGFNALGGGAAPMFVTLAGLGSALFVARKQGPLDAILIRRGLVLMLFGYALNFLSPSWFSWGSWFVLHMMGFAMALAPLWRRLSNHVLLALAVLVLAATPLVQHLLDTPIPLTNPRMRDVSLPGGPLRLALAESQFPILPWLSFYLVGFASGRWLDQGRWVKIAGLGLAAIATGGASYLLWNSGGLAALPVPSELFERAFALRLGFFPAPVSLIFLLMGLVLLVIAGVVALERRVGTFSRNNPMVTLGRASLTLLMLHVPLFRDWSRPLGWWRSFEAGTSLAVVFGFFIAAAVLSRLWQRADYRYGAEWVLRRLGG